ncbi:MAG TPA: hypothetical protein VFA19_12180 [Gaiellaceae bacterium]|nr:hypothetical protein [Gaiellaceae bacterium]
MEPSEETNELHVSQAATPPTYVRVEPRYFGLTPHLLAGALAACGLLAGVALLAAGRIAVGLLLLVAGLMLAALFAEQARRRRASSLDRVAANAVDRSLALAGFTRATVGAWTGAGRRVTRLRLEARRLGRERSHVQYELGGAVHAGDDARMEELRGRMRTLDAEIELRVREARAALEEAQRRTARERRAVAATRVRRPG